jgi:RNA polymerase sigma-70 factor, ECF subfamily
MPVIPYPGPSGGADPDLPLVQAMARGDQDALETLYVRHGRGVWAFVLGQLGDPGLAEEVLQDVMLAAWHGAPGFRGASKVRTWLLTIAHHRAVNAARSLGRDDDGSCGDYDEAPRGTHDDRILVGSVERVDVLSAIDGLSAAHRAVLELVFYQGLTVAEAAEVLAVAPGTIKSRLYRARAALRAELAEPARGSIGEGGVGAQAGSGRGTATPARLGEGATDVM